MTTAPILPITLVIVSDFEPGPKTWADEVECLDRCLSDRAGIPAEIVIAASAADRDSPPPDWPVPLKLIFVDSTQSGAIKDGATAHASHDLLAVVEADCNAVPGWLDALYQAWRADPALDAVTGLTSYAPTSAMRRVAALYDRSYLLDRRKDGSAVHVSNNGALYREDLLERFPFGDGTSPFVTADRRLKAMRKERVRIGLAPEALQYHAYGGWAFIKDVRRNKGLQHMIMRMEKRPDERRALRDLGLILREIRSGLRTDFRHLRRHFSTFCKPRDLPLALIFPFIARTLELRGMQLAQEGHESVPETAYR